MLRSTQRRGLFRGLRAALVVAIGASALGCSVGTVLHRNGGAFFSTPAPVPHRIEKPFRADARLAVLWIGHASALLQIDDKLILTDPVFTATIGQFSRRMVEPGLLPEALPHVDAVLISHMHFDHLSIGSLEMIQRKVGFLVVPRKGTVNVPDLAFETVELPTWATFERGGLRITAVPVEHNGFRWAIDGAWMDGSFTGYVIEYHGLTVYFGGDTAYAPEKFAATRARFPRIDLALMPVSPINPRSLVAKTHVDPHEALLAFRQLGARWMVPIHYETFVNATDPPGEVLQVLRREMAAQGLTGEQVRVLAIGEQQVLIPWAVGPHERP